MKKIILLLLLTFSLPASSTFEETSYMERDFQPIPKHYSYSYSEYCPKEKPIVVSEYPEPFYPPCATFLPLKLPSSYFIGIKEYNEYKVQYSYHMLLIAQYEQLCEQKNKEDAERFRKEVGARCLSCDEEEIYPLSEGDCKKCPNREYKDGKCLLKENK